LVDFCAKNYREVSILGHAKQNYVKKRYTQKTLRLVFKYLQETAMFNF